MKRFLAPLLPLMALATPPEIHALPLTGGRDGGDATFGEAIKLSDRETDGATITDIGLARGRVGAREINAADSQYAGGVIADCTASAMGTDNAPAIRAARDAWIAAGPGSVLKIPAGRFCVGQSIDLNLNGQAGMIFDASDATIVLQPVPMVAFDFHNGYEAKILARFVDGGIFRGHNKSLPYGVDYGATVDVVAAGGQEAIRVSGVTGYTVDLDAKNYAGRLLRITRARKGETVTGGIKGSIRTSRGADLSKPRVAQSVFTDNGNNAFTGFWGRLDTLHNNFDAWGPVWYDVNDVSIGYLDGAYGLSGVVAGGVGVFKADVLYVGDIDNNPSNVHFYFGPSPVTSRLPYLLTVNQMHFLNAGRGLHLKNTDPGSRAADIGNLLVSAAPGTPFSTAIVAENVKGASISGTIFPAGDSAASVIGAASEDIKLNLNVSGLTGNFVHVAPEVAGNIEISGSYKTPVPGRSTIVVEGDTPVRFSNLDVSASNGSSLIYIMSKTNKTRWVSGSKSGAAKTYAKFQPAYVSPAVDMR